MHATAKLIRDEIEVHACHGAYGSVSMHVVVLPVGPDIECSRGRLAAVASHSCVLDKLKNLDWQPKHGNHSALIGGTLDICASMTTIGLSEKRVVMHLTGAAQAGGGHPCEVPATPCGRGGCCTWGALGLPGAHCVAPSVEIAIPAEL